jgi:hypothetical protein
MHNAGGLKDGRNGLDHFDRVRLRGVASTILAVSLAGATGCNWSSGSEPHDASVDDASAAGQDAPLAIEPDVTGDSGADGFAAEGGTGGDATALVDATMPGDAAAPDDATAQPDATGSVDAPDAPSSDVSEGGDAATADDATTAGDAADAAPVSDAPTVDSAGADAAGEAGSDPLDGTWLVTSMTCNGVPATASPLFTAPNEFTETFSGSSLVLSFITRTDAGPSCTQSCPYTVTISGSMASSDPTGPCTCVPAACAGACGTTPAPGPYPGTFQVTGNTFIFTTPQVTPDTICTYYGQSNPIVLTSVKQ